jgi:hypothetical protein
MIHVLSKEFKRWLGTIKVHLWHVEIIDEDNEFLTDWWSINSLSPLLKFFIKEILGLICRGLGGECHEEGLVFLWKLVNKHFSSVDRLSCTSWTWAHDVFTSHE